MEQKSLRLGTLGGHTCDCSEITHAERDCKTFDNPSVKQMKLTDSCSEWI